VNVQQAIALCAALGVNAHDCVENEPRYVALVRVFDPEAADKAMDDHDEEAKRTAPPIKNRGRERKTLAAAEGGAQ
jgi:prophage antirepressor-like protein